MVARLRRAVERAAQMPQLRVIVVTTRMDVNHFRIAEVKDDVVPAANHCRMLLC